MNSSYVLYLVQIFLGNAKIPRQSILRQYMWETPWATLHVGRSSLGLGITTAVRASLVRLY
ncbi:MAG: hypothetical protein IGS38_11865 [Synechococcales cyanobacterium M58_A2018_015]|nr:hypothetical protein [Synechococcales cyanobacterium M58_A2018_015]